MSRVNNDESGVKTAPWYSIFYCNSHLLGLSILVLLVAGIAAIKTLPRLEDPRIDTRNVLVITPYPGASAERVEALVTDVIEDELRQLFEIKEMKSTSRAGISIISLELQAWVDNSSNEQIFSKIRDNLANAKQNFPLGAGTPRLDERRGATSFTLLVGIRAPRGYVPQMSLLSRMSNEFSDRLRNVPGTELVRIYGELDEEINVNIDPQQLISTGINIAQASQLVVGADPKLPAGVIRSEKYDIRLQVSDELSSVEMIKNLPLSSSDQANFLRLGDIAEISRGWRSPADDIALVNGEQVVFVAARMQATLRADEWTANAIEVVEEFNQLYGGSVVAEIVFEQNVYTQARLADLSQNLLLGSLVVMAVVFVFMGFKASWIVGLSLPLCAAFAVFSLSFYGEQIHQMSIFGIIVAIGLLIDNAIVITDEIRSKLLDNDNSRLDALVSSLRHLFNPLLASTLTTILGFMPIFLLSGNIGDFVGPIAISVVMALIGSLFISLTIIAALAAKFLPRANPDKAAVWYQQGLQMPATASWFKQLLYQAIKKPALGLCICIGLPVLGFGLSSQLGNVFFPSADRDQFEVYLWMSNGTALQETHRIVSQVDEHIRQQPTVLKATWLIGGSAPSVYYNQVMNRDNTAHFANAVVNAESVSSATSLITQLQQELDERFPQAKVVVKAFGQGPPISAPVGLKIFGPDLNILNQLGEEIRLAMSKVPGVSQSIASITLGEPELVLNAHRDTSQLAGMSLASVAQQLQFSLDGKLGGSILEGTEDIPIRIRVGNTRRSELTQIESLPLVSAKLAEQDAWLAVSALGDFTLTPGVAGITRFNGQRVNNVEAFILPGATAIDVSNKVQALIDSDIQLPPGYRIKMAGDADEQQEALGQLGTYAPVLLVLMIATLILSFSSLRLALVIAAVAGLSVGLGMFSLWLSGLPIGFNPLLGCAGLIGVAINGSIVVIASINANPKAKAGDVQQIVHETMGCSRHILSTTVTTVGGFIPLLLFSEGTFWPPLAVVIAGGVGFSVILSLLFTPLVVAQLARFSRRSAGLSGLESMLPS
jgi:multidrug efflux pump subunit AcrB